MGGVAAREPGFLDEAHFKIFAWFLRFCGLAVSSSLESELGNMHGRRSVSGFTKVFGLPRGGAVAHRLQAQSLLLSVKMDVPLGNSEQDRFKRLQTREVIGSAIAHLQPAQCCCGKCCGCAAVEPRSLNTLSPFHGVGSTIIYPGGWLRRFTLDSPVYHRRWTFYPEERNQQVSQRNRDPMRGHRYNLYRLEWCRPPQSTTNGALRDSW